MRNFFIANLVLNVISMYLTILIIYVAFCVGGILIYPRQSICGSKMRIDSVFPARSIVCYFTEPTK